jgi:MFS transporter, ACDE family, multidrug resistance protein
MPSNETDMRHTSGKTAHASHSVSLRQPKAVWAVAFACVIAFMGLGLVDPILPAIAAQLHANPSQVELLFTSYMLITGIAMLITGAVSSRIGIKWTLLSGLFLIVLFSALAGASHTINQIVLFRGGWGLGNALFIATALAAIVSLATGGTAGAIILYEAALGLGMSTGPLLGGWLGGISWRGPFFGVAILMALGFLAVWTLLPPPAKPKKKSSVLDPLRALRYGGLLTMAVTALFYNFGFFTLLAFSPFVLNMDAHGLGYVFFGWGVLLAITSVFLAPHLQSRFSTQGILYVVLFLFALVLAAIGLTASVHAPSLPVLGMDLSPRTLLIALIIIAGGLMGINTTLITTAVMHAAPVERGIASAAYSFVRFVGGAIAPWLAGKLAESFNPSVSFYAAGLAILFAILTLFTGRRHFESTPETHSGSGYEKADGKVTAGRTIMNVGSKGDQ